MRRGARIAHHTKEATLKEAREVQGCHDPQPRVFDLVYYRIM